jgi:hypothetical protein
MWEGDKMRDRKRSALRTWEGNEIRRRERPALQT